MTDPKILGLPDGATRVFRGRIHDVWHWEVQNFAGEREIFEAVTRPASVKILAQTAGGKFLVLRERQPGAAVFWSLPGGRADGYEEAPATAAARELREETGFSGENLTEIWAQIPRKTAKIRAPKFIFFAKNCEKVGARALDPAEEIAVREVSWRELLELAGREDFRGSQDRAFLRGLAANPAKRAEFEKEFLG